MKKSLLCFLAVSTCAFADPGFSPNVLPGGFSAASPITNPSSDIAPTIATQPASATVATGAAVSLAVVATGTPAPSYQWSLNGQPIRNANTATYKIATAALTDAGAYSVSVRNPAGSVSSSIATVSVATRPIVTSAPASKTVNAGTSLTLAVTATGATDTYQWQFNGQNISGATTSSLALTNVGALEAGTYAVKVTDSIGLAAVEVSQLTVMVNARLTNLSVRGVVGSGLEQLTVGFSISGTGTKSVLVRGIGPTLTSLGVTGVLATPELTLYGQQGKAVATNTAWGGAASLAAVFARVGAFALPAVSLDTALLESLAPGGYTATVTGTTSTATGTALAELYDADNGTPTANLVNESGRAYVTNSNVLAAGFVVAGATSETVLVRGIGPTLETFNVHPALPDTTIVVYNSAGKAVAADTGWGNDPRISSCADRVGAFALPPFSKDSAIIVTLAPGAYTAQVTGATGSTGQGMVEIYEVK